MLTMGRSAHFLLHWLLRAWRNPHLVRSFQWPKFLVISLNSCPLNELLVWSHRAEIIIVKRLFQRRNNVTRVRSDDDAIRVVIKTTPLAFSATLPTFLRRIGSNIKIFWLEFCNVLRAVVIFCDMCFLSLSNIFETLISTTDRIFKMI